MTGSRRRGTPVTFVALSMVHDRPRSRHNPSPDQYEGWRLLCYPMVSGLIVATEARSARVYTYRPSPDY